MFLQTVRFLFFALAWVFVKLGCPQLKNPAHGSVVYLYENKTISMLKPVGTLAVTQCTDFYESESNNSVICLSNGNWNSTLSKCVPECGKSSPAVSLIVNGADVSPGTFPWHIGIYRKEEKQYEFWCGGSLISDIALLTAAHCTWNVDAAEIIVAVGKIYREFKIPEGNVQKVNVRKIFRLPSYQDASGNYNGDISVVFFKNSIALSEFARPICIDWDQNFFTKHLAEGNFGTVLGWGLTEENTFSAKLKMIRLPLVTDEKCISEQQRDFKKFVTHTSFCAGFANGTGVCNGDSGGGLAFFEQSSGRWFVQGLVSVSPRKLGTPYCDPYYPTIFTKVVAFTRWLKNVLNAEYASNLDTISNAETLFSGVPSPQARDAYAFIRKYFEKDLWTIENSKRFQFPHSRQILESAKLLSTVGESRKVSNNTF